MPIMETRIRTLGDGTAWADVPVTIDQAGCDAAAKVIARLNGYSVEVLNNVAIEVAWKWEGEGDDALRIEPGPFSRECGVTAVY